MTNKPNIRRVANVFGALGYLSCMIQWMLVFAVLVLPILASDGFRDIFIPTSSRPSQPTPPIDLPGFLDIILIVISIIFTLAITIYIIVTIPKAIGRTGQKVTHTTAAIATTHIVAIQHKVPTAKQKKSLLEHITWSIKLLLLTLPLLLLFIPSSMTYELPREHLLFFGAFCALMSLLWFGAQYTIAKLGKLDTTVVW